MNYVHTTQVRIMGPGPGPGPVGCDPVQQGWTRASGMGPGPMGWDPGSWDPDQYVRYCARNIVEPLSETLFGNGLYLAASIFTHLLIYIFTYIHMQICVYIYIYKYV